MRKNFILIVALSCMTQVYAMEAAEKTSPRTLITSSLTEGQDIQSPSKPLLDSISHPSQTLAPAFHDQSQPALSDAQDLHLRPSAASASITMAATQQPAMPAGAQAQESFYEEVKGSPILSASEENPKSQDLATMLGEEIIQWLPQMDAQMQNVTFASAGEISQWLQDTNARMRKTKRMNEQTFAEQYPDINLNREDSHGPRFIYHMLKYDLPYSGMDLVRQLGDWQISQDFLNSITKLSQYTDTFPQTEDEQTLREWKARIIQEGIYNDISFLDNCVTNFANHAFALQIKKYDQIIRTSIDQSLKQFIHCYQNKMGNEQYRRFKDIALERLPSFVDQIVTPILSRALDVLTPEYRKLRSFDESFVQSINNELSELCGDDKINIGIQFIKHIENQLKLYHCYGAFGQTIENNDFVKPIKGLKSQLINNVMFFNSKQSRNASVALSYMYIKQSLERP